MSKTEPKPYRLIVKVTLTSKAKLLRLFPTKSFVAGELVEILFYFHNVSDEPFPGMDFAFEVKWPTRQYETVRLPIPPLEKNVSYCSPKKDIIAFCEGFGLIFIVKKREVLIKDGKGRMRKVEFYRGKRVEDYIDPKDSIAEIKVKSWEEIYEFWAMMISAFGLLIIALEKIFSFLNWLGSIMH